MTARVCAAPDCGKPLPPDAWHSRAYCGPRCRKHGYLARHRATATMKGGTARTRKAKAKATPTVDQVSVSWSAARRDLGAFAAMIGQPLSAAQARLGTLARRVTVVIAPRQAGKSRSLATLGTWWAFRKPDQHVLIVSASDDAARRLLAQVKSLVSRPPLLASVEDDLTSVVRLSNGSIIRSVPASERAIRGWSVDLLLVDEAALVPDDILAGAAIPTTAARDDARIVLASTPWAQDGLFYGYVQAGDSPHVQVIAWSLADAPWISREAVDHARATLPDARFRAEYQAEFVGDESAYFDPDLILASVADYALTPPDQAQGGNVVVGADWGRAYDLHGLVAVGVADDGDVNGHPVLVLPWVEASRRPYADQVAAVAAVGRPRPRANLTWRGGWERVDRPIQAMGGGLTFYADARTFIRAQRLKEADARPGYHVVRWVSEANGVGAAPSEDLVRRVGSSAVQVTYTTIRSKEDALGRVRTLLADGRLALPAHQDLLRQLRGLSVRPTATGQLSIAAANPAVHDDLADALCLAISAVPWDLGAGSTADPGPDTEWVTTPAGIHVPKVPRPRQGSLHDPRRSMVTT